MKFPRMAGVIRAIGASFILAVAAGATHAAPCPTVSDASLANCGFDNVLGAGNWVASNAALRVDTLARNGGFSLRAAGDDADGGVSQGGLDANGIGYTLEFWLRFGSPNTTLALPGFVTVSVDGVALAGVTPGTADGDGWTPFTGVIGPVANDWVLAFAFTDPQVDDVYMDDVTLTARSRNDVPEPGTLLLVGAALASVALVRRRSAR